MKPYDPRQPLFSIHIPKCAGSSFTEVLKVWFGRGLLRHYFDEKRNTPPKRHTLERGLLVRRPRLSVCVHGHFNRERGFGLGDYYPQAQQLITVLRDPFDLHLSTYFYVKREAASRGEGAYRSGKPHPILANGWDLAGYLDANPRSGLCRYLPAEISPGSYAEVLERRFLFIGIAERLQDSVDRLARVLGLGSVPVRSKNASEWSESIPDGAREAFARHNPLETAIYAHARARFDSE